MTVDTTVQPAQNPGLISRVGTACKDAAIWLGRVVKNFFWNKLVPAVKSVWEFMKTPYGWSAMAAAAGITFLTIAICQRKDDDTIALRVGLYAAATLCFIGAGATFAMGCLGASSGQSVNTTVVAKV